MLEALYYTFGPYDMTGGYGLRRLLKQRQRQTRQLHKQFVLQLFYAVHQTFNGTISGQVPPTVPYCLGIPKALVECKKRCQVDILQMSRYKR